VVGRVPEELCDRSVKDLDLVVASGRVLYNTTHHMSISMTPFHALYGYDALSFADIAFGDIRAPKAKDWVQES